MEDFIKKRFESARHEQQYSFPQEFPDGSIRLEGDLLVCDGQHGLYSCQVNTEALQYAYVLVDRNGQSFLLLSDGVQHAIPTQYTGFREMYIALTKEFGFDDDVFFAHVHQTQPVKKVIWRKTGAPTYKILKDKEYNDYADGFEIQSPEKCFIDWDTPHEVLAKHAQVHAAADSNERTFSYPVRIGNIAIQELSFYKRGDREDAPVLYFSARCYDSTSSDESYEELKATLLSDFASKDHLLGYERQDQKSYSFRASGMYLGLVYNYDSDWSTESGYTYFSVENRRDYPELLEDKAYEATMEISEVLLLEGPINTSTDYRRNKRIKLRPAKLKEHYGEAPLLWLDRKNGKIGFAASYYCQVFDAAAIKKLVIQNILPAKGPGGAYLEVSFTDDSYNYSVLTGDSYVFDRYQASLQTLTGKEVSFASEYYNC